MKEFRVEGLDHLMNKLNNIQKAKFLDKALTKSCLLVEGDAKTLCPVDDGQLRQSITSEVRGEIGVVGTNVECAPYVHQGTGIYAVNGDGRKTPWSYKDEEGNWHTTIGQHPQPFLEQALDINEEKINDIFKEELDKQVNKK